MKIKKNDFIELEFDGKTNGEIFDTTNSERAKKMNPNSNSKPIIICVGTGMLLKGFDENLEEKEIGKKYSIQLKAEQAFGKRNSSLIKTIPLKIFKEKDLQPSRGMVFQLDNNLVKILSVSGGRVIVDFNNLLAGKEVTYDFVIKRKVVEIQEKINSLQDFFFKKRFKFEINNKDKKIIFLEKEATPFIRIFEKKFKEILGYALEIKVESKKDLKDLKDPKDSN